MGRGSDKLRLEFWEFVCFLSILCCGIHGPGRRDHLSNQFRDDV